MSNLETHAFDEFLAAVLDANRVGMEAARKVKEMLYTAPQATEPIVTSVQHHPSETIDVYKET